MPLGLPSRQETTDSLKGASQIQPTPTPIPNLVAPAQAVPNLANSAQAKVSRAISGFVGEQVQAATNIQNEAATLDGQMAAAQGQSMDDLELDGNKWAMAGYRAVEAQTITSTMLAAQQEMLRQVDFADDPDEYRAKYVARLEGQLEGMDPKTARLVREQMAQHSPALAAQHMTANMSFQEKEAYRTLSESIDIMALDDTALANLVANASGEGGGFAGLSRERRESAVAQGVVRAFENGNPQAYAKLVETGVLAKFGTGQLQLVNNARVGYQTKIRGQLKAAFVEEKAVLDGEIAAGMGPSTALAAYTELFAKHGMEIRASEGGAAYLAAKDANEASRRGSSMLIERATLRGEYDKVAELTWGMMTWAESRNNPNATGPLITAGANKGDKAIGIGQVMPKTVLDPGYNIRPGDPNDPASVTRVSKEYWAYMIKYWKGDVLMAAVSYNAGLGNAKAFDRSGRNWNSLPDTAQTKPYAMGIAEHAGATDMLMSAKGQETAAAASLKLARERVDMEGQEQIAAQREQLENDYADPASGMTTQQYIAADKALFAANDLVRDNADIRHTMGQITQVANDTRERLSDDQREAYDVGVSKSRIRFDAVMGNDGATTAQKSQALSIYDGEVRALSSANGYSAAEWGEAAHVEAIGKAWNTSQKKAVEQRRKDVVSALAISEGRMSDLSKSDRDVAWSKKRDQIAREAGQWGAVSGASAEDIAAFAKERTTVSWREQGMVDPLAAQGHGRALTGELLTTDGRPKPEVVNIVNAYQEIRDNDDTKHLAASFFNSEQAQANAEDIIAKGVGNIDGAAEGIMNKEAAISPFEKDTHLSPEQIAVSSTAAAIQQWQSDDVDIWQTAFMSDGWGGWTNTTTKEAAARRDAVDNIYAPLMEQVVGNLQLRNDVPSNVLIDMAVAQVNSMTSSLGESIAVFEPGNDFLVQAVGKGRAGDMQGTPGIEDDILSSYLKNNAEALGMEGILQFSDLEFSTPTRLLTAALDFVPELLGFEGLQDPALSYREGHEAMIKGMRPYQVAYDQQNGQLVVRFRDKHGTLSAGKVIDMRAAGDEWMAAVAKERSE